MASIKIHRDLFNFERKRNGFTIRQITGLVAGIVVMIATTAFFTFFVELPFILSMNIGLVFCMPVVLAGFMPLFGMPADVFAKNFFAIYRRGQVITFEGEEIDKTRGDRTHEHKNSSKAFGYECRQSFAKKGGL